MAHLVASQQQFSFLFAVMDHVAVVMDHVSVNLLVLVVTLSGRARDFVDPRLLNFHLCPAKMNVEVFVLAILIFRFFLNVLFVHLIVVVQLMVKRDSYPRVLHLILRRLNSWFL